MKALSIAPVSFKPGPGSHSSVQRRGTFGRKTLKIDHILPPKVERTAEVAHRHRSQTETSMTRLTRKHVPGANGHIPPEKEGAPDILVPRSARAFTFGDHLRHLHEHAGDIPPTLDEFGRCARCVNRGWFKLDA